MMQHWTRRTKAVATERLFAGVELARRVESGWDLADVENARLQQRRVPESQAEVLPVAAGHAVFMGAGSSLSQAQGLGLSGPVDSGELSRMEEFYRDRDTPCRIEIASLAHPSLLPALSLRGYVVAEQTHCLVCPLDHGDFQDRSTARVSSAHDVRIARVEPEKLELWVDLVLRCFFEGPETPSAALREGTIAMAMVPALSAWMATVDNEPAGGGSLFIHGGLALLCGDGTLPGHRYRGVQTALLKARLAHARTCGCDLAEICTQPGSGSQRNAESQGFQLAYARTLMIHH
ncbi:MAG: GNAT family N-acetyltransferase [Planctomycetaceae bacterium]|nr:GNAT family N-acetyltransferase [Planctomycetaceae bacterium]